VSRNPARDRGSAAVLSIGVVVVLAVLLLAVAQFGRRVDDAARARTAADAAALAGVRGGRELASELARENGGRLTAFATEKTDVVVTVVVGSASASARANDDG
jgi:Flp pilus assembly protein TadG